MNFATRPCAALLLAFAAGGARADDAFDNAANALVDQTGIDAASFAAQSLAQNLTHGVRQDKANPATLAAFENTPPGGWTAGTASARPDGRFIDKACAAGAGKGIWNWRELRTGLSRKLDNGWLLALNYTRAVGAAAPRDHYGAPAALADERPVFLNRGRKALVLSMRRRF